MGAEPWSYFVPYQTSIHAALQDLRAREFRAGRYYRDWSAEDFPDEPGTIDEVFERCRGTGTRSILDMSGIADDPEAGAVTPLPCEQIVALFGTDKPSRRALEQNRELFERIKRARGIYVIAYEDGQPSEIFFAGYSFD